MSTGRGSRQRVEGPRHAWYQVTFPHALRLRSQLHRAFQPVRCLRGRYAAFVAHSVSRLSRIAGVALGAGGALTLGLGAVIFFVLPFAAPFAVIEALVGVRVFAGRLGSAWLALPGALIGLWLGAGMVDGFAGPIAFASISVKASALVATAVAALRPMAGATTRPIR